VVQSESYGPIANGESYPYYVNDGSASFTGSHVQYVDYARKALAEFMTHDGPASDFVKGFGEVIKYAYNLKGEPVGPRNKKDGVTSYGAHYGNTDANGKYSIVETREADWHMQSLCSAHLEEKHQWGHGIGVEDNLFMTNEEWIEYNEGSKFVGIGGHVIDLATSTAWAIGVLTQGGFEKVVEINSQHKDYVVFATSGTIPFIWVQSGLRQE